MAAATTARRDCGRNIIRATTAHSSTIQMATASKRSVMSRKLQRTFSIRPDIFFTADHGSGTTSALRGLRNDWEWARADRHAFSHSLCLGRINFVRHRSHPRARARLSRLPVLNHDTRARRRSSARANASPHHRARQHGDYRGSDAAAWSESPRPRKVHRQAAPARTLCRTRLIRLGATDAVAEDATYSA